MKAHAYVHKRVDQIQLRKFCVTENMFKQNIKVRK